MEDMDHQPTDAGAPQGAHDMVEDRIDSGIEGEKQQESEAGTEEEVESDGLQGGDEVAAAPSGTGLLKPNVEIQPRTADWPAVRQDDWIGGTLMEGNCNRWQAALIMARR